MIERLSALVAHLAAFVWRRSALAVVVLALGLGVWALWYDSEIAKVVDRFAGDPETVARTYVPLGKSPAAGDQRALVTVVVFADFHCGYCRKAAAVRRAIRKRYGDKVRWVFKHFTGRSRASRAAAFAAANGRFFALADRLFSAHRLSDADIERLAGRSGVDIDKLRVALRRGTYDKPVRADTELGRKLGVRGTPSYFINGRRLRGHWPLPFFDLIVRQEMARARAVLARGVERDELYRRASGQPGTPSGKKAPPKLSRTSL